MDPIYGSAFDEIAEEYDRHRPAYPDALVDRACEMADLDGLVDGGAVALISYFGLEDPGSAFDQQAVRASLARIAPDLAAEWPAYRGLDATLQGAAQRRGNVSEAWAWLGSYAVARGYVCHLFEDAQLAAIPMLVEQTGDALTAVLGTMSFWARLSPGQRDALRAENRALHKRLGRPIRSSLVACLLRARRVRRG